MERKGTGAHGRPVERIPVCAAVGVGTKTALVDAPAATQVALWAKSAPQFEQARLNSSCNRSECRNARPS